MDVPHECGEELLRMQNALRKVSGLKVKFVEPENLHLTLSFLGEISDEEARNIKERLIKLKFSPFKARLGKLGVFPSASYVRVIWISLEPSEKIKEIAGKINETLGRKDEKFESHITLARVRDVSDKAALEKALQDIKIEKKEFEVREIKLKKSTLSPQGPVYEDIFTFSFK